MHSWINQYDFLPISKTQLDHVPGRNEAGDELHHSGGSGREPTPSEPRQPLRDALADPEPLGLPKHSKPAGNQDRYPASQDFSFICRQFTERDGFSSSLSQAKAFPGFKSSKKRKRLFFNQLILDSCSERGALVWITYTYNALYSYFFI